MRTREIGSAILRGSIGEAAYHQSIPEADDIRGE
jgi:hypothetical protein